MVFRCDCGNELYGTKPACKRCLDLDGHTEAEGRIIEHLRDLGGFVGSQQLADHTGSTKRYTLRVLKKLIDRGRVVRVHFSNDEALFCLVDGKRESMKPRPCFVRDSGNKNISHTRSAKRSAVA